MATDISNRTKTVIAWNRFPALNGHDLLLILIVGSVAAFQIVAATSYWNLAPDEVAFVPAEAALMVAFPATITGGAWWQLHGRLVWRRKDRINFLRANHVPIDNDTVAYIESFVPGFGLAGAAIIVAPPAALGIAFLRALGWEGWAILLILVAIAGFMLIAWQLAVIDERRPTGYAKRREELIASYAQHRADSRQSRRERRSLRNPTSASSGPHSQPGPSNDPA